MAPRPAIDRRLQRLASTFTPDWLAGQRWFRGKSRGVARVELIDAAEVAGSPGWLLVLEATDAAGDPARYQVPAVLDRDAFREPDDDDGVWRELAALMLVGGELIGTAGRWAFGATPATPELLHGGAPALRTMPERRLGVEQSNTSVAVGDALILKVYRLLEAGVNPEVEMNAFLTEVGFREAPALAGSATYSAGGEACSAGMLQQLVRASGDGWSWMLERLATADGRAEPLRGAKEIGQLTGRMHAALASRPGTPGFPARRATTAELAAWGASARQRLSSALGMLHGDEHARLASIAPRIAAGLDQIESAQGATVSRIHGDFHLGQLLRTREGFTVIDFEGEPARSLAERRAPASPLRDLAGMLRSLDYAVHAADPAGLTPVDRAKWLDTARSAFLDGYGRLGPDDLPLLAAFELEKACYEVAYEADNRPDWIWLPLDALERA